jgi:chorismate mutase
MALYRARRGLSPGDVDALIEALRDPEIVRQIARRQGLAGKIAKIKTKTGLPIHDEGRIRQVLDMVFNRAVEYKIDPVSVQKIFEILIVMSEEWQKGWSGDGNLP